MASIMMPATDRYKFVTADGLSWAIGNWSSSCVTNKKRCAMIHVDINGKKPPYTLGMDFFQFELYPITNEVLPCGVYNSGTAYDETKKRVHKIHSIRHRFQLL